MEIQSAISYENDNDYNHYGIGRRLLQTNFTANFTNHTNNYTIPMFTTTSAQTTQLYTTINPTTDPTIEPTKTPSRFPSIDPTFDPTTDPTQEPTSNPSRCPTIDPTNDPTKDPTLDPTTDPISDPTKSPSKSPSNTPTSIPTTEPTSEPTGTPSNNPSTSPTLEPTIEPTWNPTNEPTREPTFEPTTDPTVIPTESPTEPPDCVFIRIEPDFHKEDIQWTLTSLDDNPQDPLYGNYLASDGAFCSTTKCISFSIDDEVGDGLNYGEGTYSIQWNGEIWQSLSSGNYFDNEEMTLCKSDQYSIVNMNVFVSIEDESSFAFLDFLDEIINPLLQNTLQYNLIFTDIVPQENITCSDKDCSDNGYCVCDVKGAPVLNNIILALCYASSSTLREIYDVDWAEFWMLNETAPHLLDICNSSTASLLDNNYQILSSTKNLPSYVTFSIYSPQIVSNITNLTFIANYTNIEQYELDFDDMLMSNNIKSACNLYSQFKEIIEPICNNYTSNYVPYLCQADICGSDYYCSVTDPLTLLKYESDTRSGQVEIEPFIFIETVGTQLLNFKEYYPSPLYGIDEYYAEDTSTCFGLDHFTNNQNENLTDVFDTIPIIAAQFDQCDYKDVIWEFQIHGARAIIFAINIASSSEAPTPSPTMTIIKAPLNYNHWLSFNCSIEFNTNRMNPTSFYDLEFNLTTYLQEVLLTNFRDITTEQNMTEIISYSFEANVTVMELEQAFNDSFMSNIIRLYLPRGGIKKVACNHLNELNES